MQIPLGKDFFSARDNSTYFAPTIYDTSKLINGHMLIVGSSGVGKSFTIRRFIRAGLSSDTKVRFHVFDVHGDLDIPDASVVTFSESAPYGLNPLVVNPDPDFGGVRKAIQAFLRTINQSSVTSLGVKQESVIRNLMLDVYKEFGFMVDNPSSWSVNEIEAKLVGSGRDNRLYLQVPFEEKGVAQALGARWEPALKHWWIKTEDYKGDITKFPPAYKERHYPSVADLAAFAQRLYREKFLGSEQEAIGALVALNKVAQAHQRKQMEALRLRAQNIFDEEAEKVLDQSKEKAIDTYSNYINAIKTGDELENLMKYDSADVLKSVSDRLENLKSTGIFKDTTPPFDPNKQVWRYKLNALSQEEKKMLVLFLMQDLFNKAVQSGEKSDVVEVIVLDELSTYTSSQDESGDGIIGVIAREARKFGLAMWAANQSPANVPESLISSVGTKIILGVDEMYWDSAIRKLRVDNKLLEFIAPTSTMAVQMKEKGTVRNKWRWTNIKGFS